MRFFNPSKRNTPDATKPASDPHTGETRVPTGGSGVSRPADLAQEAAGPITREAILRSIAEANANGDDSIHVYTEDGTGDLMARIKLDGLPQKIVGGVSFAANASDMSVRVPAEEEAEEAKINPRTRSAVLGDIDLPAIVAKLQELHRTAVDPEADMEMVKNVSAVLTAEELILFSSLLFDADYIELGYACLAQYRESTGSAYFSRALLRASMRAKKAARLINSTGNTTEAEYTPMFVAPEAWYVEKKEADQEEADQEEADQEAEDADDFDADQLREDLFGAMHGASTPDDNDELYIKLDRPSDKAVVEAFLKRIAQEPPRYPDLASSTSVDVLHEPNLSDLSSAAYETAAAGLIDGGYTSADSADPAGAVHEPSIRYLFPRDGLTDAQIGEMIRRGQEHPAAPVQIPGFTNHAQFNLEELADEMAAAKPTEEDAAAIAALAEEDSLTLTPEEAKQIADAESAHATSAEEEAARAYLTSLGYNPDLVSEARIQRHGTTVHHIGADGRHLTNFHPAMKYGTLGGLK